MGKVKNGFHDDICDRADRKRWEREMGGPLPPEALDRSARREEENGIPLR